MPADNLSPKVQVGVPPARPTIDFRAPTPLALDVKHGILPPCTRHPWRKSRLFFERTTISAQPVEGSRLYRARE